MPSWKPAFACLVIAAALMLASLSASPQAPRTIRIVVPLAPGGGADFIARLVADQVARMQGVTVVIENQAWIANHGAAKYNNRPCHPVKYVSAPRYPPPTTATKPS